MSKKTKRQVRKAPATVSAPAKGPAVSTVATASSNGGSRLSDRTEFHPDYTPVIKDLKRIGLLASAFFVILVALSFIL